MAATFIIGALGVVYLLERTPTAFIPNEDQGYYFVGMTLPSGSSLERTEAVSAKVLEIVKRDPAVVDVIQINGFNFLTSVATTNAGFIIVILKPWDERNAFTENARAIILRVFPELFKIPEASVFAFPPPPIPGLGAIAGWQLQLEDVNGIGYPLLSEAAAAFTAELEKRPEIANISSPFQDQVPILRWKVIRILPAASCCRLKVWQYCCIWHWRATRSSAAPAGARCLRLRPWVWCMHRTR